MCVDAYVHDTSSGDPSTEDGFFFWSDGYIAIPVDTEYPQPFTYFYEKSPFITRETFASVQAGATDDIVCRLSEIQISDEQRFGYYSSCYTITFSFHQPGTYTLTELTFHKTDGTALTYPIGTWVFEVGDPAPEGYETIYNTYGMTSNSNIMKYDFSLPENTRLIQMKYMPNREVKTLSSQGELSLDGWDTPVKAIAPQLILEADGKQFQAYGAVANYGNLAITEDIFLLAKEEMQKRASELDTLH